MTAVLIYAPGLGHYASNSAEVVADVIAATLARNRAGHYGTETSKATAPRGLRVGKTVVGPGGKPVLEVFELDYRHKLEDLDDDRPEAAPGVVRAGLMGVAAFLRLLRALVGRRAKTGRAKFQLLLGLVAVVSLVLATVLAVVAALGNRERVATTTGLGVAAVWAGTRRWLLGLAQEVRRVVRYVQEQRQRDTVTQTLDEAVDGLLDQRAKGPIHVLGYSFGSLVAIDALFPSGGRPAGRLAEGVASLTTVGAPADAVSLYYPNYLRTGRTAAKPDLSWTNVFIPSDVFGSNFADGNDRGEVAKPLAGVPIESLRYTDEKLSVFKAFAFGGFRTHSGYWDRAAEASCFHLLVDRWVPPAPPTSSRSSRSPAPGSRSTARNDRGGGRRRGGDG